MCYEMPCKKECSKREVGCRSKCFKYMYWLDHKPKAEKKVYYGVLVDNKKEYRYERGKRKADNEFFLTQIKPHMTINGEYIGYVR